MSASVAVGIAAGASVQSAANAARIAAEHRARCRTDIADFHPEGASVERMKSYAECVQYMHPDPVSPESVPFIKAGIVVLLVSMVAGFWWGKKEENWLFGIIAAITAPFLVACLGAVLVGVVAGIRYVLS